MKFSNTEIESLAKVLKENELGSIAYEQDGCKIILSNGQEVESVGTTHVSNKAKVETTDVEETSNCEIIKCPLIGHFYLTATPDSEPFVKVGSEIKSGDVVGILQAMKVSNEIKSEINGEIVEIYVESGQFVDYDAPLFKVRV